MKLKSTTARGGVTTTCTASGDILEISADVAVVISGVYSQLMHSDPAIAQFFRYNMRKLISEPNSPVWDPSTTSEGVCIIQPKKSKEEN